MFTLTTFLPDESWCTGLLRVARWNNYVICPRCQSNNIKKYGLYRSYQKYFCKQCKRWFNDKTGTVFHYSHTSLKKCFLVLYLYFVLWPGFSIRYRLAVVPYLRCYRFIRKKKTQKKMAKTMEGKRYILQGLYNDNLYPSKKWIYIF